MGDKNNPQVYDYRYALDYALCQGPIDSLNYVWIKDKRAFCGAVVTREDICVNDDKLFGGDSAEGGIEGVIECYMGTETQHASFDLARRMGFPGLVGEGEEPGPDHWTKAPGYPGIAHLFFRRTGYNRGGFKWGTNNPYLPGVKASVTRIPRQLSPNFAAIRPLNAVYEDGQVPDQQNPDSYASGAAFPIEDPALVIFGNVGWGKKWNNGPVISYSPHYWYDENNDPSREVADDKVGVCDIGYKETGLSEDQLQKFLSEGSITSGNIPVEAVTAGIVNMLIEVDAQVDKIGLLGEGLMSVTTNWIIEFFDADPDDPSEPGQIVDMWWGSRLHIGKFSASRPLDPRTKFIRSAISSNPQWIWNHVEINQQDLKYYYPPLDHKHCDMEENIGELPDANPSHIIYELLVDEEERDNSDMTEFVNAPRFLAAAETLFNEGFGISIRQDQPLNRQELIKGICEHIRAAVYQHPRTGQWDITLFRNDYDVNTLETVGTDECQIVSGSRRAWSQCISEITVEYTDPQDESNASVTSHNDAGAAITGNRVPEVRNYKFIRNSALAQIVADRDVVEASYPLWSGTINLSRKFWDRVPGELFILNYIDDDYHIENMVVRITGIEYGAVTDRYIRAEVVEDIYSVARTTYKAPQAPIIDPSTIPLPIRTGRPQYLIPMTLPYALVERMGNIDQLQAPTNHYQTLIAASIDFQLDGVQIYRLLPAADLTYEYLYTFDPSPAARADFSLPFEIVSRIPVDIVERIAPQGVSAGSVLMLAPDIQQPELSFIDNPNSMPGSDERQTELIELVEYDSNTSEWIVKRGLFDTVPRQWIINQFIVINIDNALTQAVFLDNIPWIISSWPWFARSMSRGYTTAFNNMWRVPFSEHIRSLHPTRPANVKVNGVGPDPLIDANPNSDIDELVITWSSRNRTLEENDPPFWDEGNVTPEEDTTYIVRIRDSSDPSKIRHEETEIEGTTVTLPISVIAPTGTAIVEVYAVTPPWHEELEPLESIFASQNYVQVDRVGLEWQG